jgi:hypothetical protein
MEELVSAPSKGGTMKTAVPRAPPQIFPKVLIKEKIENFAVLNPPLIIFIF